LGRDARCSHSENSGVHWHPQTCASNEQKYQKQVQCGKFQTAERLQCHSIHFNLHVMKKTLDLQPRRNNVKFFSKVHDKPARQALLSADHWNPHVTDILTAEWQPAVSCSTLTAHIGVYRIPQDRFSHHLSMFQCIPMPLKKCTATSGCPTIQKDHSC